MTENQYIKDGTHPGVNVKAFCTFISADGAVHEWLMTKIYSSRPTFEQVLADAKASTGCENTQIVNAQVTSTPFQHKTHGCKDPNW